MNDKKKQLIVELRKNGRRKLTDISAKTGIAVSTLFDIIHRLEEKGFVDHKTHVNFSKLGFGVHLLLALKTDYSNRERLGEHLSTIRNVNSVFRINSGYDFLIEAVFRDQKEAQDFIDTLMVTHNIESKTMFNVIETVHREKFLTSEEDFG
jgi:Lrp/AsnC family transcriptional regulator, leucine-responsive regulatory protein